MDIDGGDGTPPKKGFENIVVFQNDPTYQEVWDHARMIVCRYSVDDDFELKEKRVVFRPVVIDMLDVVSIPVIDEKGEASRVDCWMEITKGRFPLTTPIEGAVKVGSPLTLAIFVRDPRKRTDLRVKDCYAYDDPQVAESNGPALLQLTDFDGCPTKPKLIEVWKRTHDAGPTGATIIAFTTVTAFKFPDRPDLQLTCNIELCRNQCSQRCGNELPGPVLLGPWTREVDFGSGPPQRPTTEADEDKPAPGGEKEETTTTTTAAPADGTDEDTDEGDGEEATSAASDGEETTTTTEASASEDSDGADSESEESDSSSSDTTTPESTSEETTSEATETEAKEEDSETESKDDEAEEDEATNEEDDSDEETADSETSSSIKESPNSIIKAKSKTTSTTTTTTTTTTKRPTTTKKGKKGKTKPTTAPKSAAQIKPNDALNSIVEQIHWSTTTLRPLKELMDLKSKPQSSKKSKKATTTTTTTTTTTPSTTTTTSTTTRPPTTTTTKKPKKAAVRKLSTTTTTTTTTTTAKPTAKTTVKSTPKPKKTTTKTTTSAPIARRARAPSASHPDEFPNLHIVEDKKRFFETRRPNALFRFKSLSQTRTTTIAPPASESTVSTVVITEVITPNSTSSTIRPIIRSFRYRGRLNKPELESTHSTQSTNAENLQPLRRQTLRRSDHSENSPNFHPFQSFQRFQALRIRKTNHRVERSVESYTDSLNSNSIIFHTRLNSAIRVI